ncbi:hypothetical protein LQ757_14415 [Agromyces sp. SYSU K20354]|uniref:hypothetical protein n=1 Tax=Agromyces cavernae TaxID=2898659 RepID=UPI001E362063|nr:hypothetical protein [Agromyces cavernae]MCD2443471.1 hypothetical protein [Agromyces cavernae]
MQARPEGAGALDALHITDARKSRRGLIGTIAVLVVIVLQIAIPLVALLQPPPQKFGFQMYSGLGGVTATVVDGDGAERSVTDFDQLVAKYRPDTDWLPLLPEAICDSDADAAEVRVEQSGRVRSIECG